MQWKVSVAKKKSGETVLVWGAYSDPMAPRVDLSDDEVKATIGMLLNCLIHGKSEEEQGRLLAEATVGQLV